ncbi:hypothetical protein PTKIN_Ptkin16aG0524400 [Pterospermum kingtungense]
MLVNVKPHVDCIIGDGVLGGVTLDFADELGIPIIQFRTVSAASVWAYFAIPDMIQAGELPIRDTQLNKSNCFLGESPCMYAWPNRVKIF